MTQIWLAAFLYALIGTGVGALLIRPFITALAVTIALLFSSTLGVGLTTYPVAHSISQEAAVGGYKQFLNVTSVSADVEAIPCEKNGRCVHVDSYCDPYTDIEIEHYTDSKGNLQSRPVLVTKYNTCPRTTVEFNYTVKDDFGNVHRLGYHVLEAHPKQWRPDIPLPGNDIERGVPPLWQHAFDSIKIGRADPITLPGVYENYILSSETTTLREYSDNIKELQEAGLLPDHTVNLSDPIHDFYKADKLQFVKMQPPANQGEWQDELARFNVPLGTLKQGDMHSVFIKASAIPKDIGPDRYAMALKAHWLNDLGKSALAKNGIMLVIGVDDTGKKIDWARAATGMPKGNEEMTQALQFRLQDQPFSLEKLFGSTKTAIVEKDGKKSPVFTIGGGLVPQIVMHEFPFKRACMKTCEDGEGAGFVNLKDEIPISTAGIVWGIVIDGVIALILWSIVLGIYRHRQEERGYNRRSSYRYRY